MRMRGQKEQQGTEKTQKLSLETGFMPTIIVVQSKSCCDFIQFIIKYSSIYRRRIVYVM